MRVVFLAEAQAEAEAAFNWYEGQRPGLGAPFRGAIDRAVQRVRATPFAYAAAQYRELRRAFVERFPYAIYYRVLSETIVVVGVVHVKRHPREWKRR